MSDAKSLYLAPKWVYFKKIETSGRQNVYMGPHNPFESEKSIRKRLYEKSIPNRNVYFRNVYICRTVKSIQKVYI